MKATSEKFDNLIQECLQILAEEDMGMDDVPMGDVPMGEETPPSTGDKSVTQGYAYLVNIVFMMLKFNNNDIPAKYIKLSDNEVTDSDSAYRYIDVLIKLLPPNVVADLKNDTFEGDNTGDQIELDQPALVEMANTAIKALFHSPKDTSEFSSKIEDIQNTLSLTGNKVTTQNANLVYQQIKDFVIMN